jgi:2-polyprenyl-3-methyl-5-hydroxy-6-metoxy-1,4-benzoquinol methylase
MKIEFDKSFEKSIRRIHNPIIFRRLKRIIIQIENSPSLSDFNNKTTVIVGAGGGQLIEYGRVSKHVVAVDYDRQALDKLKVNLIKSGLELINNTFFDF